MAKKFNVAPAVLDWVLEQIATQYQNPKYFDEINSWKSKTKLPTFAMLEAISKYAHIPIGYLFLEEPPKEDIPLLKFRTVANATSDTPSRNLIDTINDMENIVEWTREYLISEGYAPNQIAGKMKGVNSYEELANYIRSTLNLNIDWFKKSEKADSSFRIIREKISNSGTVVMMNGIVKTNSYRKLDIQEFRAFTIMDSYAPLVFINGTDSDNGRLFSLLHEFAHICLGVDNLFNMEYGSKATIDSVEQLCNATAAEILVPTQLFRTMWEKTKGNIKILTKFFKCSSIVIARRALEAKYITQDDYDEIEKIAINGFYKNKERQSSGGNFYLTQHSRIDSRFFNLLLVSLAQGKTLYTEAFHLTCMNRKTFEKYAGGIG